MWPSLSRLLGYNALPLFDDEDGQGDAASTRKTLVSRVPMILRRGLDLRLPALRSVRLRLSPERQNGPQTIACRNSGLAAAGSSRGFAQQGEDHALHVT